MGKQYGIPLKGFSEFSRSVASEGIVLLKNEGILPITKEDHVAVFGRCQIDYYRSGTGSGGAVNVKYAVNALEGLRNKQTIQINEDLSHVYEAWVKDNPFDNGGGGWAMEPWFQKEMPLKKEVVEKARTLSNKAIVIIGRTAGEDKDNVNQPGGYRLTDEEMNMLSNVTSLFDDVIVVLNVANIIDMSWSLKEDVKDKIKGIVYAWQGGQEGGNALADVLSGDVTPSGKLVDTIAYLIEDYPTTKNFGNEFENIYEEDIYVGYRYFETFAKDRVLYPFGFGLSYTTFSIRVKDIIQTNEHVEIECIVVNTGKYSGKEVVQVYLEATQGKLGKPKYELKAFKKTKKLGPNESDVVKFKLDVDSFASYDDLGLTNHKSCFVIEEGQYKIHLGSDVRNLQTACVFKLDERVVSSHIEAMTPNKTFKRMHPGRVKHG